MRLLLAALALAAGATAGHAQSLVSPAPAGWSSLSANQHGVLAPLERDWSQITPEQRQKWVEVANRYGAMTPDERRRAQDRMAEWSRLPPSERARARLNFQEVRQLSAEERQSQWDAYRALPPAQKRELAERAQSRPAPLAAPRRDGSISAGEKSALVRSPVAPQPQSVGPTVVQRGAGATTSLVSKSAKPPLHQQAGLPKVAATPGFVDADTLLPQRGAQGAARPSRPDDKRSKNDAQ